MDIRTFSRRPRRVVNAAVLIIRLRDLRRETVDGEVVVTVAPDTSMSLADQAQAVVKAVPTISGFWGVAQKKRNTSTLRDHYDMMAGDPELTEDERDGLLTLRKIREAQLSGGGQKTLI